MKKYLIVIKNSYEEIFTYRINFLFWRFRMVVQFLAAYFLWLAIVPANTQFFNYSQTLVLTYIIGTVFLTAVVFSTRSYEIGENINQGDLSIFLIRPINYFLYWFSRDIGDKIMNIGLSIIELSILFIILKPPFYVQADVYYLLLTTIAVMLAVLLHFFFGCLLGLIGFWSPDVWAPRFIFFVIVGFFAGSYFPLDILPKGVFFVFQLLPFSYLLYFPLKIYLGQLTTMEILLGLIACIIWIIIMFNFLYFIWSKGLKSYTAQGR